VRRGVERRLRGRAESARLLVRRPLVAGAAALVLLSTVGAAAALWRHHRVDVEPPAPAAGPRASVTHHKSRGHRRSIAHEGSLPEAEGPDVTGEVPPAPAGEETAVAAEAEPQTAPLPAPEPEAARRSRRATPAAASSAGPVETEARLLALALAQIRQQHDPVAALATLDRLERRFPGGVLADEARATRIEAAVAARDLRTATRLVEGAAIPAGRSGVAILVMRGELRAQAGRCADAVADFTRVLGQGELAAGELAARALYGRAVCFQQMGQGTRARVDLESLRRNHPRSRLGHEAQRLLDGGE
jgi:hypothetical protein